MDKPTTFSWDSVKAQVNYLKHKITFEEAKTVFFDDNALDFFDFEHSVAEERHLFLGMSYKSRVLILVYCERHGNVIRIISARKATKTEQLKYWREK